MTEQYLLGVYDATCMQTALISLNWYIQSATNGYFKQSRTILIHTVTVTQTTM